MYGSPHTFDGWGRITPPVTDHICGTEDDFFNGGTTDPDLPPVLRRPDGIPLCCGADLGGLVIGGAGAIVIGSGGAELSGSGLIFNGRAWGSTYLTGATLDALSNDVYVTTGHPTSPAWLQLANMTVGESYFLEVWCNDTSYAIAFGGAALPGASPPFWSLVLPAGTVYRSGTVTLPPGSYSNYLEGVHGPTVGDWPPVYVRITHL